ncbi:phosphatidylserine decarboxylase family protein [Salisaeta longa]|uniref:phosphatidylserine decarboxylase family protein n=1 Tax=Salisaeta longa TaxID=503170 RepID=UPI00042246E4|nr:phosphatidylserine decarboxylase family protein [Salisaeta longa]
MIAREGYSLIAGATVLALLLGIGSLWLQSWMTRAPVLVLAVALVAFTVYFFRDPDRTTPPVARNGEAFVAPADGRVVEVVQENEPLYLKGPSTRISIFLSPLDVHVNRAPANGVVEYVKYRPGDYLVAWHPKASEKNERSEIGTRHPSGSKVLFKQIAGAVARRIVFHVETGDTLRAGERFGIVKFGSRMDVHVPPGVEVTATVDDVVRAGETVLGTFPDAPPAAADASEQTATTP